MPRFLFEVATRVDRQDLAQLAGTGRMIRAQQQAGLAAPLVRQLPRLRQGTGVRAQLAPPREQNRIDRLPALAPILLGPSLVLRRRHRRRLPPAPPGLAPAAALVLLP